MVHGNFVSTPFALLLLSSHLHLLESLPVLPIGSEEATYFKHLFSRALHDMLPMPQSSPRRARFQPQLGVSTPSVNLPPLISWLHENSSLPSPPNPAPDLQANQNRAHKSQPRKHAHPHNHLPAHRKRLVYFPPCQLPLMRMIVPSAVLLCSRAPESRASRW